MTIADTAETVQRAGAVIGVGGGGTSVYFGLSPGEWQIVGIVGGILVGLLGVAVSAAISIYFKRQHLLLAREQAGSSVQEE